MVICNIRSLMNNGPAITIISKLQPYKGPNGLRETSIKSAKALFYPRDEKHHKGINSNRELKALPLFILVNHGKQEESSGVWSTLKSRIIKVMLGGGKERCGCIHVLSCYAPPFVASREGKDQVYDDLKKIPSKESYVVNAHVGS